MLNDRLMESIFQLRTGLLRCCARFQASHQTQPPDARAIHIRAFAVCIHLRLRGNRDCHILRRANPHCAFKARWRDTNDREGDVVQIDLLADDVCIAAEALLPVPMTQHSNRTGGSFIVIICDGATQQGLHTQAGKVPAGHGLPAGHIGLPVSAYIQSHIAKRENI